MTNTTKKFLLLLDISTLPILMVTHQDVPGAEEEGHSLGGVETQPRPVFEQVR